MVVSATTIHLVQYIVYREMLVGVIHAFFIATYSFVFDSSVSRLLADGLHHDLHVPADDGDRS